MSNNDKHKIATQQAGLVRLAEIARLTGNNERAIERYRKDLELPYIKIGRSVYYNVKRVLQWFDQFTIIDKPDETKETETPEDDMPKGIDIQKKENPSDDEIPF